MRHDEPVSGGDRTTKTKRIAPLNFVLRTTLDLRTETGPFDKNTSTLSSPPSPSLWVNVPITTPVEKL